MLSQLCCFQWIILFVLFPALRNCFNGKNMSASLKSNEKSCHPSKVRVSVESHRWAAQVCVHLFVVDMDLTSDIQLSSTCKANTNNDYIFAGWRWCKHGLPVPGVKLNQTVNFIPACINKCCISFLFSLRLFRAWSAMPLRLLFKHLLFDMLLISEFCELP